MSKAELIQEIIEDLVKCQRPSLDSSWKSSGLSHAQMGMLYLLRYHQEVSPKDIADYLGISKSAVSQLMDPLVDKGFVQRQLDSNDRRVVRLNLTLSGKKLFKQLARYKYAGLRSALDSLDASDLEKLSALHKKMLANIK